jgi:hypothetical protein
MKLRVIATLALTLALAVGSASAQSIGVYFDPAGGTCNLTIGAFQPFNMYINANLGGATSGGITGAEFRVSNFPSGWFGTPTPNASFGTVIGNPLAGGCNIAAGSCQPGAGGVVNLFSVSGFATSVVGPTYMQVLPHSTPSNPNFVCPLMVLCDGPVFTKVCVSGGVAIINGPGCTVAVEPKSWTGVKNLYN